ncbi:Protein CBG25504 [Caenorhabditis briggsae]|uniref:Protein CBG25504 n=1 Tax=Caenorhabditis briggsae TaxID=6238 RepID=B6IEP4_CAEBR|nr:Protein CBG25504 [Caenorhabditis briggsae]CAR98374.1 Protein CBG25504 [Caenorhabditis briggsae]
MNLLIHKIKSGFWIFDNPIDCRTTEDPFCDPFAEPANNKNRNDGLPTLSF